MPENTLAAIRYTWRFFGGIPEVDVRTTVDGVMVCIHDDTLGRTTNASPPNLKVSERTFHELRQLDAGGGFHSRFRPLPGKLRWATGEECPPGERPARQHRVPGLVAASSIRRPDVSPRR